MWLSEESALLAWVGLLLLIFFYVLGYDLWAHYHPPMLTMTEQFRRWMRGAITGPVIFALWVAIPVGVTYHFFVTK